MKKLSNQCPKVSTKAVFRSQDKVLYYETDKGIRDIPGGHIEFGETIYDALRRELKEELDFDLNTEPVLIHSWEYISSDKLAHRVYVGYRIDIPQPIEFSSKEYGNSIKFLWITRNEVLQKKFLPGMESVLLKALGD